MSEKYTKDFEKISKILDMIVEQQQEINEGYASASFKFSIEKLNLYMETLFNRFAPFKVGSKVRLTKDIGATLQKGSGWYASRKMLGKGATGVVKHVDIGDNNKFVAGVVFDNDFIVSTIGSEEKILFTDQDRKGVYYFNEDDIEEIQ